MALPARGPNGDGRRARRPNKAYYFDTADGRFVPRFQVKQTLAYNGVWTFYRLFDLDGTITEFDDFTGGFRRRYDPAGN